MFHAGMALYVHRLRAQLKTADARRWQAALHAEVKALKAEGNELGEQCAAEKFALATARTEEAKLRRSIVQSPARLQRSLVDLTNQIDRDKGLVAEAEKRGRELAARLNALSKVRPPQALTAFSFFGHHIHKRDEGAPDRAAAETRVASIVVLARTASGQAARRPSAGLFLCSLRGRTLWCAAFDEMSARLLVWNWCGTAMVVAEAAGLNSFSKAKYNESFVSLLFYQRGMLCTRDEC